MINAITSAISGLNNATRQVEQSAQSIAGGASSSTQTIEDIIDIKVAQTSYEANLAVIQTADELTQELLNSFDETV